jgi:hypothetical protein
MRKTEIDMMPSMEGRSHCFHGEMAELCRSVAVLSIFSFQILNAPVRVTEFVVGADYRAFCPQP